MEERIRKASLAFRRTFVNDELSELIQAITQAKYPQLSERSQATTERTKPIHDATSHFRTSMEYFYDNEPMPVRPGTEDIDKYLNRRASKNMIATRKTKSTPGWDRM